MAYAVKSI